ncbi:MAG TPA: TetR/AcrR family transcriptional regulator [Candidatus Acidoferrales bacterium]|nr:TetR/AcrR family transcriptional regulator [Candidatus Acidoferrales bacterium]
MPRTADEARRAELLERAVDYVLQHGLAELSLRPLAKALNSSPRVLLYYFGSKEELVVEIIRSGRARQRETFAEVKFAPGMSAREVSRELWRRFSDPRWLPLMRLFFEVYALAMQAPQRFPGFLERAVEDWLDPLQACSTLPGFDRDAARAFATVIVAGYRGFLLDLCATGDRARVDRAVDLWLSLLDYADAAA